MTDLLEEMIDAATKAETPLADLLRQCMVLAYRLELEEFKEWIKFELNGYERKETLPDYRERPAPSYGQFGNGVYTYNQQPIALHMIPEEYRDWIKNFEIPESVGSLEQIMQTTKEGDTLKARWSPDQVRIIGPQIKGIEQTYQLLDAWVETSATFPQEIL